MSATRRNPLRVAVTSELTLVAQAVRVALDGPELEAHLIRWPGGPPLPRRPHVRKAYDAGILLSDLDTPARLEATTTVLAHVPTRWLVLTGAPRGPLWGGALAAGAWRVVPSTTRIESLRRLIQLAAIGRGRMLPRASEELQAQWGQLRAEREALLSRFALLTPREREILAMLRNGDSVATIALLLGTSTTTVRSQVKAILRKLDVRSQLAAVAAYTMLLDLFGDEPHPPPPVPPAPVGNGRH